MIKLSFWYTHFHKTIGFTNTSCNITGLDAYWDYTIAVRVKVDGFTPNNSSTNLKTKQDGKRLY